MPLQPELPDLDALVGDLAASGRGVIMTMGKGGVGKTTLAAALALRLSRAGYPVHLTTTDPAARVAAAVGSVPAGLTVSRIDPKAETAAYAAEVLATAGADLDEQGRVLVVTLPEATPVHEAAVLQADLHRAGISSLAWVINQSLTPLAVSDPVLAGRRAQEHRYIEEVAGQSGRTYLIPWQADPDLAAC